MIKTLTFEEFFTKNKELADKIASHFYYTSCRKEEFERGDIISFAYSGLNRAYKKFLQGTHFETNVSYYVKKEILEGCRKESISRKMGFVYSLDYISTKDDYETHFEDEELTLEDKTAVNLLENVLLDYDLKTLLTQEESFLIEKICMEEETMREVTRKYDLPSYNYTNRRYNSALKTIKDSFYDLEHFKN